MTSSTVRRLLAGAAVSGLLLTGLGVLGAERHASGPSRPAPSPDALVEVAAEADVPVASVATPAVRRVPKLPGGGTRVFGKHRFLVAYYGTAGTGSLGVLGETAPDEMHRRLRRAAHPFLLEGERIQTVYELIVTVADPIAGPDGDFSHDIAADSVRAYIEAAHRNGALVVLDIQPGRADFLTVAKRWAWALEDPWVGLALDPEWRMGPAAGAGPRHRQRGRRRGQPRSPRGWPTWSSARGCPRRRSCCTSSGRR